MNAAKSIGQRETKKNMKREKIIEAAAELFSRKNYHQVMMDDVAKLVKVAKGTVYNYFDSKEELYFSIMRMRMEKLTVSLQNKIGNETNTLNSLYSFIVHLYMFMMKYQNFFLMYRREFLKADNELCSDLRELESGLKNLLAGIVRSGKGRGFFRNIEDDFAVSLILGSIYGAINRGIENHYTEEQAKEEREKIFDFILHGLFSGFENFNPLPLKNKTIVITRTFDQSKESAGIFIRLGAEVIVFPTLEIAPPESWEEFDSIVKDKHNIDYLIFTSAHAVKMFRKRCVELGINFNSDFVGTRVIAVGNKTKNISEKNNIPVHIVPEKFSAAGVVEKLSNYDLRNKIIFIPRSAIGREELPEELGRLGAIIKTAAVYNVTIPTPASINGQMMKLKNSKPDLFIFTSPSTFNNFLEIMNINSPKDYFTNCQIAVIGPTTKAAIEEKNIQVTIMPSEYTIDGLAKAIVDYYKKVRI
jgi:uroporphyrinogen-III synthase